MESNDKTFTIEIPAPLENLQLPSIGLFNDYILREKRIFYIDYEIDINILDLQREIIRINFEDSKIPVEERVPIKILIDTIGGNLAETMSLVSTIEMSKTPIYTINAAEAYSGGCMILMSGHKRYAMPYSIALIHTGNGELNGTHEQVMAQSQQYAKQIKNVGDFICSHTKINEKIYKKKKEQDWYLDLNQQIQYGIVDEEVSNLYDILSM